MRQRFLLAAFPALLLFLSCSAPPKVAREEPSGLSRPPTLAITLKIASIDLFGLKKRIEKKDLENFVAVLKKEQVEVLAMQGIVRTPTLKTRVDVVTELAALADMRQAFGETFDISGQQRGNAVFSQYPIRGNLKKEFDVPSAFLESALQVAIDAGVRDVRVVSTRFPEMATGRDVTTCVQTITGLQKMSDAPFVVGGNLPATRPRGQEAFIDIQSWMGAEAGKTMGSRLWYTEQELFKVLKARTVKTDLGVLIVAEFGLYQNH